MLHVTVSTTERRETYVTLFVVGWGRCRKESKSERMSLLRYHQARSHLHTAAASKAKTQHGTGTGGRSTRQTLEAAG